MIFVTLGSQKFQFNRLLEKMDELVEKEIIKDEIFAQIGVSDYNPKHFSYKRFLNREEFQQQIQFCDIVITHGGTGTIINAVKQEKKVIAIPRLKKYGEHVDDHQIQLIKEFSDMNFILACYDIEELEKMIKRVKVIDFESYHSNTQTIINDIKDYLKEN